VVCGMGGYVTLPVAMAARLEGVPVVLHEQNAVPGIANRLAARVASRIAVGVDAAAAAFPPERAVVVGNPVRPEMAPLARGAIHPPRRPAPPGPPGWAAAGSGGSWPPSTGPPSTTRPWPPSASTPTGAPCSC